MKLQVLVCAALVVTTGRAAAQIMPIPAFAGDATEDFESHAVQNDVACLAPRILGGRGDLCALIGDEVSVAPGFTFFGTISSHGGLRCARNGPGGAVFTFDAPVQSFGGWFGTVAGTQDGTAVFYDALGNTIGVETITAVPCTANCGWTWNGWDAGAGPRIKSVYVNSMTGTGANLVFDDMVALFGTLATGTAYCNGDGSGNPCPCSNESTNPPRGCLNSTGRGARLTAGGVASLFFDDVVLYASDMGPMATHLFFQGTTQLAGGLWGDGLRCAGGTVVRLARHTATNGRSFYPQVGEAPVHLRGGISSPGVRTYQVWYRELSPLCVPTLPFNMSNAYQITWVP